MKKIWKWVIVAGLCLSMKAIVWAGEVCMEAEDFNVESGWKVISGYEGYFPAEPNVWSANRLKADPGKVAARAKLEIAVPKAGEYNLWVRYESPFGFDVPFRVRIVQNGKEKISAIFGRKDDVKCFPGRGWLVQGPWYYHNTDYVYQKVGCRLEAGPATVVLEKTTASSPEAARVIDLLYLTDDLTLTDFKNEWAWPRGGVGSPILSKFRKPVYFKIRVPATAKGPVLVQIESRFWGVGYFHGPRETYYFTKDGVTTIKPADNLLLSPGSETGWQEIKLLSCYPAHIFAVTNQPVELMVTRNPSKEKPVVLPLKPSSEDRDNNGRPSEYHTRAITQIVVDTGHTAYTENILKGKPAVLLSDYLNELLTEIQQYRVEGRRPKLLGLLSAFPIRIGDFDMRELVKSTGLTSQYMQSSPEVYGPDGAKFGFNQSRGYISLQNLHISIRGLGRNCYEGDYTRLKEIYQKRYQELKADGLGNLPQTIKLIEEAGPPPLTTLRTWDKINEQFRQYLKSQQDPPISDVLGTETEKDPALYYHSTYFRSLLFARNCAGATKLVEEIFPAGSRTHSGSFLPSIGANPVLYHGIDPFLLFSERGVTAYSSEISWGMNTPDYIGPEVESYEGAIGRALAKYYDCPMGAYVISDPARGYHPDLVELTAYSLAANGFTFWNYYTMFYPEGCSIIGYPEMLKAIKRINYRLGVVEDKLVAARVAPADTAIGWSLTTDIWDIRHGKVEPDYLSPGNTIYAGERTYLYILLRHLGHRVDILGESDLTSGYLNKYKTYILVGDHLRPEAAAAIREWVRNGGTLVSVAGGGLFDHYDRPLETLKEVFGIKSASLEKKALTLRPKLELLHTVPIDTLTLNGNVMPVLGYRQTFITSTGQPVGWYDSGEIGAVANNYGKGKALIIGTLPGTAYLYKAFPLLPYGRGGEDLSEYNYPGYNQQVFQTISQALNSYLPVSPLRTSEPLVEAQLLQNKETGDWYISLVNYSGKKVHGCEVILDTKVLGGITGAESPYQKVIMVQKGDILKVQLNMEKFDFLILK